MVKLNPIPRFDGYFAGSDGQIYSTHPIRCHAKPPKKPRRLKGGLSDKGYRIVSLLQKGRQVTCRVHILICEIFHGARPIGMEVCHGLGGRQDNSPENLEWGTRSKNLGIDRLRDGTSNRGERHSLNKLTIQQVRDIRAMVDQKTQVQIASEYGVSQPHISDIIRRRKCWIWLD